LSSQKTSARISIPLEEIAFPRLSPFDEEILLELIQKIVSSGVERSEPLGERRRNAMLQKKKPFVYGSSQLFVASAQGPVIIFGWVLIRFYAAFSSRIKALLTFSIFSS
jgi:hypothetical protein